VKPLNRRRRGGGKGLGDANIAERVGDVDIEAKLGGLVQGLEIRSNAPAGEFIAS
jgi:hypothetical protein